MVIFPHKRTEPPRDTRGYFLARELSIKLRFRHAVQILPFLITVYGDRVSQSIYRGYKISCVNNPETLPSGLSNDNPRTLRVLSGWGALRTPRALRALGRSAPRTCVHASVHTRENERMSIGHRGEMGDSAPCPVFARASAR